MKYEAPYGVADPNGSYINGNPATGTMGSIPPAASIENPQREIVNFITDAGGTPTDSDLHQLARAVQSGKVTFGVDTGSANVYSMIVTPPLLSYAAGQRWGVLVANTNSGASTLNISGLGGRQITYPSGAALSGNEMQKGAVVTLVDDGVKLQLQNVATNMLAAPLNYYVNATTGSDVLYNGLTPTVSGANGPFATHNHAIQAAQVWNQNGYGVTIFTADGVYPPIAVGTPPNGAGSIAIVGDLANPPGVLIHATAGEAVLVEATGYVIQGVRVQSDSAGSPPHGSFGVRVLNSIFNMTNIDFGPAQGAHMLIEAGSLCGFTGVEDGRPGDFVQVSGDAPAHMLLNGGAYLEIGQCDLKTIGNRNIGIWAQAVSSAVIASYYRNQTLGGTVTGQKYNAQLNGVINTVGQGVNYFPGTIAGATATGGQYA